MIIDEPGQLNLTIYQGATFEKTVTLKDANEAPINLTGMSIRMQARKNLNSSSTLFELTSPSGGITITVPATLGEFVILMTATTTAALFFDTAVYDLEIVEGAEVARLFTGTLTLAREVTR